jgi:hypothetical protein
MYTNGKSNGNGKLPHTQAISGRNIAHGHRSKAQRAAIAAQLHLGEIALERPTVTQVRDLCGVSVKYIQAALRADPEHRRLLAADALSIPQVDPPASVSLARQWRAATAAERAAFAKRVGVDRLWDQSLAPALD